MVQDMKARHTVAFQSEIGRSHRVNQDAGGAWSWLRADGTPVSLLLVADGVSAGRRSEDASRLVASRLYERVGRSLRNDELEVDAVMAELFEATRQANHEVAARPHEAPSSADATTLVAAICIGTAGGGVWVGDSRVYFVSPTSIVPLTSDHSWAGSAVRRGAISEQQAAEDPRAHMITRWLGPPDSDDPGIDSFRFQLADQECILCCSDGLYGYFVPPASGLDSIPGIVDSYAGDLRAATQHLVDLALERGGHDDISAAALQVHLIDP